MTYGLQQIVEYCVLLCEWCCVNGSERRILIIQDKAFSGISGLQSNAIYLQEAVSDLSNLR